MVKVLFFITLALTTGWSVCLADPFGSVREDSYWSSATVLDIDPGDLTHRFNSAERQTGLYVWRLQAGEYLMPPHGASINVSAEIKLVGAGKNQTMLMFQGHTRMLMLMPGSSLTIVNATLAGITVGYFVATIPTDTVPDLYPRFYIYNSEWWAPTDDIQSSEPGGYLKNFYDLTQQDGIVQLLPQRGYQNDSAIEFNRHYINFPGAFLYRLYTAGFGIGGMHLYYTNVTQRESPGHEMEALFNQLVQANGPPRTECWNGNAEDVGFTYRGNVSKTKTGYDCLAWDDPRTFPSINMPQVPGRFSSTEKNYCRSPRFWAQGPWCFTTNPNIPKGTSPSWELCDIPMCPGTGNQTTTASPKESVTSKPAFIAGITAAAVLVLMLALFGVWYCCFRRKELLVVDDLWFKEHGQYGATDDKDFVPASDAKQPWHVKEPFETTLREPPMRESGAFGSLAPDTDVAIHESQRAHYDPIELAKQAHFMMEQCRSVDSLAQSALEYKFGPAWAAENKIDTTRLIGEGGIGKVYAGLHNGLPAAYKVINQMKTPDAMLRFVRKCVLPIVNVQMLPTFPSDHPHLLQLYDCLMFPQYYSLLAIKQGASAGTKSGNVVSTSTKTNSWKAQSAGSENLSVSGRGTVGTPGHKASINTVDAQKNFEGQNSSTGSGEVRSFDCELYDWEHAQNTETDRAINGGKTLQSDVDANTVFYSTNGPMSPSADSGARKNGKSLPYASLKPTSLPPVPDNEPTSSLKTTSQATSHGSTNGHHTTSGNSTLLTSREKAASRVASKEGLPATQGGECLATRDIIAQIIMISPLCELGTLTDLLRGSTQIPVKALPLCLRDSMAFHLSKSLQVGEVHSIQEDREASTPAVPSTVTINDLPTIWQLILKLQLSLQVLDGITALHAVSLVHCDIKLDNIFLTANRKFEPFGICAKVGDLDTCRSLHGAHLSAATSPNTSIHSKELQAPSFQADRATGLKGFRGSNFPNPAGHNIHFTSCMKGTPGYLAPEMIIMGRVTAETDIFSLAVTISIMLADRAQFHKRSDLHMKLVADFPTYLDYALTQCLKDCLNVEPALRPPPSKLKMLLESQLQSCLKALLDSQMHNAAEARGMSAAGRNMSV